MKIFRYGLAGGVGSIVSFFRGIRAFACISEGSSVGPTCGKVKHLSMGALSFAFLKVAGFICVPEVLVFWICSFRTKRSFLTSIVTSVVSAYLTLIFAYYFTLRIPDYSAFWLLVLCVALRYALMVFSLHYFSGKAWKYILLVTCLANIAGYLGILIAFTTGIY